MLGSSGQRKAYTKAIRVAGEHGAWKDSVALLEELKQKRLSADAAVYSALGLFSQRKRTR